MTGPARTRSEYRWTAVALPSGPELPRRAPTRRDRDELATLILAAYRGTVDDEGETHDDALEAVDEWFGHLVPAHSFVVVTDDRIAAVCFVVGGDGVPYIDPIVVDPAHQRRGLGRRAVSAALASVVADGATEVGATITDGNTASEALFASLGFVRVGPWPP